MIIKGKKETTELERYLIFILKPKLGKIILAIFIPFLFRFLYFIIAEGNILETFKLSMKDIFLLALLYYPFSSCVYIIYKFRNEEKIIKNKNFHFVFAFLLLISTPFGFIFAYIFLGDISGFLILLTLIFIYRKFLKRKMER